MSHNRRSRNVIQGVARSANRAMYYAMGYTDDDFDKPMVGVANGHSTITPRNAALQKLADAAVSEIAGGNANWQVFGTPTVSDGNLAPVKEGDSITIDANRLPLQLNVGDAELSLRRAACASR